MAPDAARGSEVHCYADEYAQLSNSEFWAKLLEPEDEPEEPFPSSTTFDEKDKPSEKNDNGNQVDEQPSLPQQKLCQEQAKVNLLPSLRIGDHISDLETGKKRARARARNAKPTRISKRRKKI